MRAMECPGCEERFNSKTKKPKILPCGHSLCQICAQTLRRRQCLQCHKDWSHVTELPDNIYAVELIEEQECLSALRALQLIEEGPAVCTLTLRKENGDVYNAEWRADESELMKTLVSAMVVRGDMQEVPRSTSEQLPPPDRSEEINLHGLSLTPPTDLLDNKAVLLANVRGVRRMVNVHCNADPDFALDLLQTAAPRLEELDVWGPRPEHLQAVHVMPKLRRLRLHCDATLDAQPPKLAGLLRPSSLTWLCAVRLPRPTLTSLLRAHNESLAQLFLYVGTAGGGKWPFSCKDLDALLGRCGLSLSRAVLVRWNYTHVPAACATQLAAVRRVLPRTTVQCSKCNNVNEDF